MRKRSIGLLLTELLLLWTSASAQVHVALTQDCSVQILSVSLNKATFCIGETLQVNVSYSLLYDSQDPLAIGVVTVSINAAGEDLPILTHEYTDQGSLVRTTSSATILPSRWEPNGTGQIGFVQVSGWVQDSYGSMTDYAERAFTVERSEVQLALDDVPAQIVFHDQFLLTARITNVHNSSIVLDDHSVCIEISTAQQVVKEWALSTLADGTVAQGIDTGDLGTGIFTCNITSGPDGDHLESSLQFSFDVVKPGLLLLAGLNATAYLAYYPDMNNCTASLRANLSCSSRIHDVSEANVTWALTGRQGVLNYLGAQQFGGEVSMPDTTGNYTISIQASLPNHDSTDTALPLIVEPRKSVLSLTANRTQAAYGDLIRLNVRVMDKGCYRPVAGKQVSVYVFVQTDWVLLVCALLDDDGELTTAWRAQDVGNPLQFLFMAVFQGVPEYDQTETSLSVENTGNVRFFAAPTVTIARGKRANFTIQITTLELVPIPNLGVKLVDVFTNQTWCTATTNASGHACLTWNTPSEHELGDYRFLVLAGDAAGTENRITVILAIYDGTVLRLL